MSPLTCPTCYSNLERASIPGYPKELNLFGCPDCKEGNIYQLLDNGSLLHLSKFFDRAQKGDERARAAISTPHVTTVQNFVAILDRFEHSYQIERGALLSSLGSVLAQIENRIDSAISRLSPLEFINDDVVHILRLLREARDMASPSKARNRGIQSTPGEST